VSQGFAGKFSFLFYRCFTKAVDVHMASTCTVLKRFRQWCATTILIR
jgi:hypothetical protein